jgi:hypothetical protein
MTGRALIVPSRWPDSTEVYVAGGPAMSRKRRRGSVRDVLFACVLSLVASMPAGADVRIRSSPGGEVRQYLTLFALVRASGERVVIDGPCLSACTLVLSTIPRGRICVTRRAILGFHAARWVDQYGQQYEASEETRLLAATYPDPIRAWIARHGGLTGNLILLRGRQLAALYPTCR